MKYFQIMARIGGSTVHIETPHLSESSARERIRQLNEEKPQYLIAYLTTAIGFAEKKPKKPKRKTK